MSKEVERKIEALREKRIAALTAYDYPSARILDEAGVDLILVGDTVGMVFAGCEDTTSVTMEQILYHTEVVRRGVKNALLVADLPYQSYETPEQALSNAQRLLAAGADAVKLEGGEAVIAQVRAIRDADIPLVGHIGMRPQQVKIEKGYKKKGKTESEAEQLMRDAQLLAKEKVMAMVLESMVPDLATKITASVDVPTIGIGAGSNCDGQIAVFHDLVGYFPWFVPPFARPKAQFAEDLSKAAAAYIADLRGEDPA